MVSLWLKINAEILQNKTIYESSNFIISIIYSPFRCFWQHREELEIHYVFFFLFKSSSIWIFLFKAQTHIHIWESKMKQTFLWFYLFNDLE